MLKHGLFWKSQKRSDAGMILWVEGAVHYAKLHEQPDIYTATHYKDLQSSSITITDFHTDAPA